MEVFDERGKVYWDMISSWWVNVHGHCDERIVSAIQKQSGKMDQVVFADMHHDLAFELTDILRDMLPADLKNFFFSDNGSTAVEIALKIAIQYCHNLNFNDKNKIVAFHGCYHGDTFGAMSLGRSSGFYAPFERYMLPVDILSYPETWIGDDQYNKSEESALKEFESYLQENNAICAIIEPLVRGAYGMRICHKSFLKKVLYLCKQYNVISIFDEVMTGFARTGSMFVCSDLEDLSPDILCLAKSLTGGVLPMGLTVVKDGIRDAFNENAFLHGHSYYANAITCAAALASMRIFESDDVCAKVREINNVHKAGLEIIDDDFVSKKRVCGSISAFELNLDFDYGSKEQVKLKQMFRERGIIIRPIGNTVYFMPPYCITENQLIDAYSTANEVISDFLRRFK